MRVSNRSVTKAVLLVGMAAAYLPARAATQSIFQVVTTPNNNSGNGLGNNGLFAVLMRSCAGNPDQLRRESRKNEKYGFQTRLRTK